ncbi:type IX secretion system outer membrane channel protein PorV [Dyadobacter sp. CY312]|uniref:type IX secretion system outer membrane channel protein PorV n=1 Tax=Dyadobacter sp. CY312 TaxID=2907303 RepID=UPI001F3F1CD6|nr:type IX secretion system outer membrane channel protein PorV [Dyadobacter sp. CY312]MCE7040878.1 type IX secretion system outer membrane channel protein PorV [Dyadobacter sp. CY312]
MKLLPRLVMLFTTTAFCVCNTMAQTVMSPSPYGSSSFLRIAPDARSAGLGDAGVALSPDANSIYWNASKNAFSDRDFGASVSYGSWLRSIRDDVWHGTASVYKKLGDKQALAASITHFNWGTDSLYDMSASPVSIGARRLTDNAFSLAYSRKLGQNFSMGLTLKYIRSFSPNVISADARDLKAVGVVAGDISAYYRKEHYNTTTGRNLTWSLGAVLANIGDKFDYSSSAAAPFAFLPTTFKLGGGLSFTRNGNHKINLIVDASKLVTPTPVNGVNPSGISPWDAIWKSFSDAPGGFKEEMQEVILSGGAEYWYKNKLALRGGYFGEHKYKGDVKYFTTGAGVRFCKNYGVDLSYLIPVRKNSPIAQTYRVSLLVDFGGRMI